MARRQAQAAFLGMCPICRKKIKEDRVRIIDKNDAVTICCAGCYFCLSSLLFSISSVHQNIVATAGLLTDAQEEDMALLRSAQTVCADDALAMHRFLEGGKSDEHIR